MRSTNTPWQHPAKPLTSVHRRLLQVVNGNPTVQQPIKLQGLGAFDLNADFWDYPLASFPLVAREDRFESPPPGDALARVGAPQYFHDVGGTTKWLEDLTTNYHEVAQLIANQLRCQSKPTLPENCLVAAQALQLIKDFSAEAQLVADKLGCANLSLDVICQASEGDLNLLVLFRVEYFPYEHGVAQLVANHLSCNLIKGLKPPPPDSGCDEGVFASRVMSSNPVVARMLADKLGCQLLQPVDDATCQAWANQTIVQAPIVAQLVANQLSCQPAPPAMPVCFGGDGVDQGRQASDLIKSRPAQAQIIASLLGCNLAITQAACKDTQPETNDDEPETTDGVHEHHGEGEGEG